MSKNTFSITGNTIYISRPEWDFIAQATLLFGNVFIKSVCYDMNMDRGNACYLEGDTELASYEEHYYKRHICGIQCCSDF